MLNVKNRRSGGFTAFGLAFLIAFVIFLPLLLYNKGLFVFLGDYNVQQIPFYKLAHEAVRNGALFWNWNTDLGANFIGSYSFYLLFSPFFWLTLPFPNEVVPYLMAPLLMLKSACAALTAYWYIKRFVQQHWYAVIGSLLYAFSGWMMFNIFFNHFHDVAVFFPLLLIALEELVENNRKGFFAAMVAVNCLVNYWFFIGEAVFVLLYVVVRLTAGGWGCTFKRFCQIALEALLGLGVAMVGLLPSVLAIMGNSRTGSDDLLSGWLLWVYGYNQRLPAIIQSFFFPPELPSRPNFFPDMGAKWASLSAWLPLFSTVGVLAYCKGRNRDFIKRLLVISAIMAVIPVLNSTFVLFNGSYYARWFYMPILLMAVATASALKERHLLREELLSAFRWTSGFIVAIILAVGFSPVWVEDQLKFGLYDNAMGFWGVSAAALICLAVCWALLFWLRDHHAFEKLACGSLALVIIGYTSCYITSGKDTLSNDNWFIQAAVQGRDKISLPEGDFVRSDLYDCMDNLGMFWGLPNIQAFHSIIPPSIMQFYPAIGIKRDVSSKPPISYRSLRNLLSVKWMFVASNKKDPPPLQDYFLYDTQMGYDIYQNNLHIPMGFCYDYAMNETVASTLGGEDRTSYMLSAIQLSDDAIIRNGDILEEHTEADYNRLNLVGISKAVADRQRDSAYSFVIDRRGFTAQSNLEAQKLMFFSVPYDQGWTATVNGIPALVEKANIGFMAVRVPAGEAVIRFTYIAPGLVLGLKITCGSLALLLLYLLLSHLVQSKNKAQIRSDVAPPMPRPSLEDYLESLEILGDEDESETDDEYKPEDMDAPKDGGHA